MGLSSAFQPGSGGSLSSSGTTLGEGVNAISQTPYVNLVNADAQQTAALNRQAGAALQTRAPQVIDPSAAASRASVAGVQHGYGLANAGLQNVINGGGPNVGAATTNAGVSASVAQQMAAAHSGTGGQGGYSAGAAGAAQGQASAAALATAQQAAAARGSQVAAAQGAYGSNLSGMGGLALAQGATQEQTALANAGLTQTQGAMDINQAQGLEGLATQQQNQGISATDAYLQQQQAAQQAAIKQQNQSTADTSSIIGDVGTGLSDVAKLWGL